LSFEENRESVVWGKGPKGTVRPIDAFVKLVEVAGIEPAAPSLRTRCSPAELHPQFPDILFDYAANIKVFYERQQFVPYFGVL
jgi:hypothetical protein